MRAYFEGGGPLDGQFRDVPDITALYVPKPINRLDVLRGPASPASQRLEKGRYIRTARGVRGLLGDMMIFYWWGWE